MSQLSSFTIDLTSQNQPEQQPQIPRIRTFSFQAPPQETAEKFCGDFMNLYLLGKVGKRLTDPNVITFNSTQKQMIQTIVETNSNRSDEKSKFLTKRAGKFLRLLWKTQKYNDCCEEKIGKNKSQQKMPSYATPIHHLRKPRLSINKSFGIQSSVTSRVKSGGSSKPKSPKPKPIGSKSKSSKPKLSSSRLSTKYTKKVQRVSTETSRLRHFHSEDKKFQKIRLSPRVKNSRVRQTSGERSFQIDLTKSITLHTMVTTKKFENMLQLLKHK